MTPPEILRFSQALSIAYMYGELSALLLRLNQQLNRIVPQIMAFQEQTQFLVTVANNQGWIVPLVLAVIQDRGQTPPIRSFLQDYPDWETASNQQLAHPCDTLSVFGGRSFIGRDDLRKFLKKMDTATGRKLLVVTAEKRKVGKTYSTELVRFLSVNRQPSQVVYHDLDAADYDPVKLARELGRLMGVASTSFPDSTSEQAARSNQELVSLLIPDYPNPQPKVWWIILDGFRQKVPSEATLDFIDQFAQRIQARQDFRLLLLNYTYTLPLAIAGFAFKENVKPLGEADLKDFLSRVHRGRHGSGPRAEELGEYLQGVDERLGQYKRDYPERVEDQLLLNMAVTDVADSI
jgi:hypothetical protein